MKASKDVSKKTRDGDLTLVGDLSGDAEALESAPEQEDGRKRGHIRHRMNKARGGRVQELRQTDEKASIGAVPDASSQPEDFAFDPKWLERMRVRSPVLFRL